MNMQSICSTVFHRLYFNNLINLITSDLFNDDFSSPRYTGCLLIAVCFVVVKIVKLYFGRYRLVEFFSLNISPIYSLNSN